ncbi:hypothetical protein F2P56_022037 [Juglans regia]|uniref:Uncharacterized protein LOC109014691 n=2 Tax=Juglans regia TaxID=51240 RepID=A0A2I4HHJ3_JUGRE|nr:uncharacterized protein LOC109017903 [Juglans regia]XP_035550932.1 uncharacterized protein LOC109014691 [Juglans regia]KAF5457962.1 hypothetical protein F2P56_022031 [Juglans regia]KAF5457968.1 hypothetical protein F2P56_022037 [Juglans regia]
MEGVGGASSVRIDRKSSIDSEPRTLSIDQIHYAREAALYVMKTMSIEDAMIIFTQGLEPVVSAGRSTCNKNKAILIDTGEELEHAAGDHHLPAGPRDIASAPF